ncbi:MAG: acyltransferase [Rhodocyclaceae bacterium]|nr:MAG: acyltransferase [Rhodocyclaceae bacterium]
MKADPVNAGDGFAANRNPPGPPCQGGVRIAGPSPDKGRTGGVAVCFSRQSPLITMTSTPIHARHFAELDVLRFVAAVAVMLFHFTFLAWVMPESTAYRLSGGVLHFPELAPWTGAGWIGVQVFFVISGFVIAYSAEGASLASFLRSRALRLLPAAWVCASATFLIAAGSGVAGDYLRSLVLSPVGPWVDPSYWTLGIELSFYGLVALLIACGNDHRLPNRIHRLAWVLGVASAAYWLLFWLAQAGEGEWRTFFLQHQEDRRLQLLLLPHGSFFALGICLRRASRQGFTPVLVAICAALMLPCMAQIAAHNALAVAKTGVASGAAYPIGLWLAAMAFMVAAIRPGGAASTVGAGRLRALGLMTYPLYLLHQVLGCLLLGVLAGWGLERYTTLACTVLVMMALGALVSVGIEPWLRRRLDGCIAAVATAFPSGLPLPARGAIRREDAP